jgi:methylmalonyl-CoA mutase
MDLSKDFKEVTAAQWKEQIVKELKLNSISEIEKTAGAGIKLFPFYNEENSTVHSSFLIEGDNDVCEKIVVKDEKKANAIALRALKEGASGLNFHIQKKTDLKVLLKDISLEHIYTQFDVSNDTIYFIEELKDHYGKINAHDGKVKCFVNVDPLQLLAKFGEWHEEEAKDLKVLSKLKHIPLDIRIYKEAGADPVNFIAIALAQLNEYLNLINENKQLNNSTIHCSTSIGGEFFTEIASLRALRKLVSFLTGQYGSKNKIHIHGQTAAYNKSSLDANTNMIRTTTEGLSAILGGCDSVAIGRYDEGFEEGTEFSFRIARNQLHILREESYLNKVKEIPAGSFYIDSLTEQVAEKAWEKFKEIEAEGGFIKCMMKGKIQEIISIDANKLLKGVAESKMILVGVNKFENKTEKYVVVGGSKQSAIPEKGKHCKIIRPIRLAKGFEEIRSETII